MVIIGFAVDILFYTYVCTTSISILAYYWEISDEIICERIAVISILLEISIFAEF